MSKQTSWIATAYSTDDYRVIAWTGVEATDETDAHIKGRDQLCERIGGYGGWTVVTRQIESPEVNAA